MKTSIIGLSIATTTSVIAASFTVGNLLKLLIVIPLVFFFFYLFLRWSYVPLEYRNAIKQFIDERLPITKFIKKPYHWFANNFANFLPFTFIKKLYYCFTNNFPNMVLLRVPIISGLILFWLPIIAYYPASRFIENLFAMRNIYQFITVMIVSTIISTQIISLSKTILLLHYPRISESQIDENKKYPIRRARLSVLLVLPTWISIAWNSFEEIEPNFETVSIFMLGLGLSVLCLRFAFLYDKRPETVKLNPIKDLVKSCSRAITTDNDFFIKIEDFLNNRINDLENFLDKSLSSKTPQEIYIRRLAVYFIYSLFGILCYAVVIYANRPGSNIGSNYEAPALLYLLLLIGILTYLLSIPSILFDIFLRQNKLVGRFPIFLCLILVSGLSYLLFDVDHKFQLIPLDPPIYSASIECDPLESNNNCNFPEFNTAVEKRLEYQGNKPKTLVVVAASGGGIQASGWTAQVLAGLQQEKELGENFAKAIGLISSASGGSVGTMFYLDQFENGVLSKKGLEKDENSIDKNPYKLTKVVKNATDDWLDSVGWGLAYPDLVRAIGLPFLNFNSYVDRGYVLEKDWQKSFNHPEKIVTLRQWRDRILKGETPIPVFNATLVENGRRFLISPLKFLPKKINEYIDGTGNSKALDFRTLYKGYDLNVTTAARLSASFPYVTPNPRNDLDNRVIIIDEKTKKPKTVLQNFHIADGGFFDNSGMFTAVQWLNNIILPTFAQPKDGKPNKCTEQSLCIGKVIILRIDAFPESLLKQNEEGKGGGLIAIGGPLQTLLNVRDSTQLARNLEEIEFLKNKWNGGNVKIERFILSFPEQNNPKDPLEKKKNYNPPLSWRLTKQQQHNLEEAWNTDKKIRDTVEDIKKFWK